MRSSGGGTPIPKRENEMRSSGSGPVIEYKLSEEELKKYKSLPGPITKKEPFEFKLSKEEYLQMRAAGKGRRDITIEYCNNNGGLLKSYLVVWGLLDPEVEKTVLKSMNEEPAAPPQTPSVTQKEVTNKRGRKAGGGKYGHITKEFVLSEFKKGKTAAHIEKEQGMAQNSIYYFLKKWDIQITRGPKKLKKEVTAIKDSVIQEKPKPNNLVSFTPEEVSMLKVFRSILDKVIAANA